MADRDAPEQAAGEPGTPDPTAPRRATAPAGWWTRRRILLASVGAVLVILLGVLAWAGSQAWTLGSNLMALRDVARAAQQHVRAGDLAALAADLDAARGHAAAAEAAAGSPAVALAAALPWLGDDVTVARELAGVAAGLSAATTGVDPLLDRLDGGPAPDLAVAADAAEVIGRVRTAADAATARLQGLDLTGLDFPVGDDITRLREALAALGPAVDAVSPYLDALTILASPGQEHTWFVALQNLGEARPSGGMLGGWLLVRTADGDLEVLDQGSNGDLGNDYDAAGLLPEGYEQVFGDSMDDWRSLNLSAHFPDNAALFAHAWNSRGQQQADGVLALGQGTVRYLAAAAGPVEVDGRSITPADLAGYLSVGIYRDYPDADAKDAAVADIVAQVLARLSSGRFDLPGFVAAALGEPGADHLQLWSADPAVQQQVEAAGLSGGFPDEPGHIASVRLANAAANKLDTFVHLAAEYRPGECVTDDGGVTTRNSTLTVTIGNRVPDGLPGYVTGKGDLLDGLTHPVGATRDFVVVHTPVQATVTAATLNGEPALVQSAWVGERQMLVFDVVLDPGTSATISLGWDEFPTDNEGRDFPATPRIVLPPLANAAEISVIDAPACK